MRALCYDALWNEFSLRFLSRLLEAVTIVQRTNLQTRNGNIQSQGHNVVTAKKELLSCAFVVQFSVPIPRFEPWRRQPWNIYVQHPSVTHFSSLKDRPFSSPPQISISSHTSPTHQAPPTTFQPQVPTTPSRNKNAVRRKIPRHYSNPNIPYFNHNPRLRGKKRHAHNPRREYLPRRRSSSSQAKSQ